MKDKRLVILFCANFLLECFSSTYPRERSLSPYDAPLVTTQQRQIVAQTQLTSEAAPDSGSVPKLQGPRGPSGAVPKAVPTSKKSEREKEKAEAEAAAEKSIEPVVPVRVFQHESGSSNIPLDYTRLAVCSTGHDRTMMVRNEIALLHMKSYL